MAGPSSVVIAHRPMARGRISGGKMRSSSVCDIGMIGPPQMPCPRRADTIMPSVVDRPHIIEKKPKPIIAQMKVRTTPKRSASQPVSGTQIASATA